MGPLNVPDKWREALSYMRRALDILDESEAPRQIGAQLDLTIAQLEKSTTQYHGPTADRSSAL